MKLSRVLTSLLFTTFLAQSVFATCEIFADLEKPISDKDPNRLACLREAHFLMSAPAKKTQEEIIRGAESDELPIDPQGRTYCRYFYRYQNCSSNKFRFARTN